MPATGIPPLARPGGGTARPAPDTALLADAAYGSRANVAECDRPDIDPLMRLKINSTAKGRGSGDAWGVAARRQLGGGPEEKIGGLTREARLENQRYYSCEQKSVDDLGACHSEKTIWLSTNLTICE